MLYRENFAKNGLYNMLFDLIHKFKGENGLYNMLFDLLQFGNLGV